MSEQVKRYTVTVVTERLEVRGTPEEIAETARVHAPYGEGWRFTMQRHEAGVRVERYEREASRTVLEVER